MRSLLAAMIALSLVLMTSPAALADHDAGQVKIREPSRTVCEQRPELCEPPGTPDPIGDPNWTYEFVVQTCYEHSIPPCEPIMEIVCSVHPVKQVCGSLDCRTFAIASGDPEAAGECIWTLVPPP